MSEACRSDIGRRGRGKKEENSQKWEKRSSGVKRKRNEGSESGAWPLEALGRLGEKCNRRVAQVGVGGAGEYTRTAGKEPARSSRCRYAGRQANWMEGETCALAEED
jgi:hypothetical protein